MITLGDFYFAQSQMKLASETYDLFLLNYPDSDRREWAMLRSIQASLARYQGPRFSQTGLIDARQRLQLYEAEFPAAAERIGAAALLTRIEESLALRDYTTARWYDRTGEDVSAATLYRRIVRDFPQTAAARRALERLEKIGGGNDAEGA